MITMCIWTQLVGLVERRMEAKEIKVIKKMALVRNSWTGSTPGNRNAFRNT
jgi:hypothetical protein